MLDFPMQFFVRFFKNHGLLSVREPTPVAGHRRRLTGVYRPLCGASSSVSTPTRRSAAYAATRAASPSCLRMAVNSALIRWSSPRTLTRRCACSRSPATLSAKSSGPCPTNPMMSCCIPMSRLLPENRKTWSSWNYRLGVDESRAVLTYNMNILQGIEACETFCVTLNDTESINPHKILGRFTYDHPGFQPRGHGGTAALGRYQRPAKHLVLRRLLAQRLPRGRRCQRPARSRSADQQAAGRGVKSRCTPARCAIAGTCPGSMPSATAYSCPTCTLTSSIGVLAQSPVVVKSGALRRRATGARTFSAIRTSRWKAKYAGTHF
jgi:hypothetical protein